MLGGRWGKAAGMGCGCEGRMESRVCSDPVPCQHHPNIALFFLCFLSAYSDEGVF